ncbi:hypothetical protein J4732_15150 [Serratia marcescens]|uniref:Uncharacterized protein n=1 Tax=Serratia marcescens TaxID=615 RepID=A0A939NQM3_SERMA|nr:hypothetical protein [Serratia marcescens]
MPQPAVPSISSKRPAFAPCSSYRPARSDPLKSETRTVLAEYGLPIAPVEIIDRRAFARAVATGRAVTEFESDGKAATEIRALWAWLKEQMQ